MYLKLGDSYEITSGNQTVRGEVVVITPDGDHAWLRSTNGADTHVDLRRVESCRRLLDRTANNNEAPF